jgi:hypothetical protein
MYISRTIHLGFVVFLAALVVFTVVEKARMHEAPKPVASSYAPVTVVDVARGVDAGTLASLVRLRAGERVVAIDDQKVANDFAAGAAISAHDLGSGKYLDLTVDGAAGARRVLVLMH